MGWTYAFTGRTKKSYIYAGSQPIAFYNGDWRTSTTPRYYYMHDRLGSVRALVDTAGFTVNNYTYNPYGEDLTSEIYEDAAVDNPLKFTAQFYDSETAQYYLRARQYDPHLARFISRDSFFGKYEEPATLHKYLYCENDPINKVDLNGLWGDGIRWHLRANGVANAYTLSDAEIQADPSGVWAQSYETYYEPGTRTETGTIWEGHSDFGYRTGDFDYTTLDHGLTDPVSVQGIVTGNYSLHFRDLGGPFGSELQIGLALRSGNAGYFGQAMHMGQDYFSHYNKGYRALGGAGRAGHWRADDRGKAPDNPYVKGGAGERRQSSAFKAANRFTKQKEEMWYLIWDMDAWWDL